MSSGDANSPFATGAGPQPRITALPRVRRGRRVFFFYTAAVVLTGLVAILFADLLWRTGWSTSRTVLLVLFIVLFLLTAVGCMHGIFGFFLRVFGDPRRITNLREYKSRDLSDISTAIVVPIHNEDVARVYEGLRTTYESLERTGQLARFDFFILSDSTDPDKWVEEERRWLQLIHELGALGRIYYRRRLNNDAKKSGNVRDFLNNWGRRYRYFLCFDADSIMRGETIVDLVKLMEAHPDVGLIQTVPALVNAESLFGRMQQFANRLYAPVFIAGVNYWSQGFGNYWGHNAIIRTESFMQNCDLPQLPGKKPFGGQILSHDFVEAALLLRENWQVWFAYDLEGSYEEGPQGLIENAQRERRWCQGNLQHALVVFAKGLRGVSRLHLLLGVFGYLASPLWLLFLLTFDWMRWRDQESGLTSLAVAPRTPYLGGWSATEHALLIFAICLFVLFLPKVLSLLDLAFDRERRRQFGGIAKATISAVAETVFSALHAPLLMLWHTLFIVSISFGLAVSWGTQKRTADGTTWLYGLRQHGWQITLGLGWGALVWAFDRGSFWWFAPVLAGMVVSLPLSVFTSRGRWGSATRALGLFLTPEETAPPPELETLRFRMHLLEQSDDHQARAPHSGIADAVLDPYVNAIHVSLLREKQLNPVYAEQLKQLGAGQPEVRARGAKLLAEGPASLKPAERLQVLADADTMVWLHHQTWLRPPEQLALWWQRTIRGYNR